MAIRKIRDHVLKPDKTTDIIHYESSADIIVVQPVKDKIALLFPRFSGNKSGRTRIYKEKGWKQDSKKG